MVHACTQSCSVLQYVVVRMYYCFSFPIFCQPISLSFLRFPLESTQTSPSPPLLPFSISQECRKRIAEGRKKRRKYPTTPPRRKMAYCSLKVDLKCAIAHPSLSMNGNSVAEPRHPARSFYKGCARSHHHPKVSNFLEPTPKKYTGK